MGEFCPVVADQEHVAIGIAQRHITARRFFARETGQAKDTHIYTHIYTTLTQLSGTHWPT